MTVEDIARRASEDLRDVLESEVGTALGDFRLLAARRRRRHAVGAAAVVSAVMLLVAGAVHWSGASDERGGEPVDRQATPSQTTRASGFGCESDRVTCLGDRRYTVHGDVDVTWTLPRGFETPWSGAGPTDAFVESYFNNGDAGVTVIHHASAAANEGEPRSLGGHDESHELVYWIRARPFLDASSADQVRIGDQLAWTVEVTLKSSAPTGPGLCSGRFRCYPVIYWPDGPHDGRVVGIWDGMIARYTAMADDSGITIIWSWSFTGEIPQAAAEVVESIQLD